MLQRITRRNVVKIVGFGAALCALCALPLLFSQAVNAGDPGFEKDLKEVQQDILRGAGINSYLTVHAPSRLPDWRKAAANNSPDALWILGACYEFGLGVDPDPTEAARYFRSSGELGSPMGDTLLGWMYLYGRLGAPDEEKALRLFQAAAEKGHYIGIHALAQMHRDGRGGLPTSKEKAAALYGRSADLGFAMGRHDLALMLLRGDGIPKDENRAAELFRLAADQGLAGSQVNLGLLYEFGSETTPRNDAKAVALYKSAADQGDPGGQFSLCLMYLQGRGGLDVDIDEARRLCLLSAQAGYGPAIKMLEDIAARQ